MPQLLHNFRTFAILSAVPTANSTWGTCSKQCDTKIPALQSTRKNCSAHAHAAGHPYPSEESEMHNFRGRAGGSGDHTWTGDDLGSGMLPDGQQPISHSHSQRAAVWRQAEGNNGRWVLGGMCHLEGVQLIDLQTTPRYLQQIRREEGSEGGPRPWGGAEGMLPLTPTREPFRLAVAFPHVQGKHRLGSPYRRHLATFSNQSTYISKRLSSDHSRCRTTIT